jgi:hypothetical protein
MEDFPRKKMNVQRYKCLRTLAYLEETRYEA